MSDTKMVDTYKARFRLLMSADPEVYREHGELVPEAHSWFRMESWLHAGKIEETTVSVDEFKAACKKFCPGRTDELLDRAGVPDDILLVGATKTPTLIALRPEAKPATKAKAGKGSS